MIIDVDELRKDMLNEDYGAFFVGGYGGALMESFDVEKASDEELVEMAMKQGIDLGKYEVE